MFDINDPNVSRQQAWKVTLNGKHIDTVFYTHDVTQEEVRSGLINHDGYDSGIVVTKQPNAANARATGPNKYSE